MTIAPFGMNVIVIPFVGHVVLTGSHSLSTLTLPCWRRVVLNLLYPGGTYPPKSVFARYIIKARKFGFLAKLNGTPADYKDKEKT